MTVKYGLKWEAIGRGGGQGLHARKTHTSTGMFYEKDGRNITVFLSSMTKISRMKFAPV